MEFTMKMPDLATTDSLIKVLAWRKRPGEAVRMGEVVLEVETDKAAMDVESTVTGVLIELRAPEGSSVAAGDALAVIETGGPGSAQPAAHAAVAHSPHAPRGQALPPRAQAKEGLFARNRKVREASDETGQGGSTLSPARRAAGRRLTESKQQIPHFYLNTSACAAALVADRTARASNPPAWDAYFARAAGRALAAYPEMNRRIEADRLVPAGGPRIGVAADVDGDLYVIPVDDPSAKDVAAISREIRAGLDAIRRRDPGAMSVRSGALTISNLGGAGVESFSAIINPPESCILAIGSVREVAVPRDGQIRAEWRVYLTLSVDHRVVNGLYAARFLSAIVSYIENP